MWVSEVLVNTFFFYLQKRTGEFDYYETCKLLSLVYDGVVGVLRNIDKFNKAIDV